MISTLATPEVEAGVSEEPFKDVGSRLSNLRLRLILAMCSAAAEVAEETTCLRFDGDGDSSKVRRTEVAWSRSCCRMLSREVVGGASVMASEAAAAAAESFTTDFSIQASISIEEREEKRRLMVRSSETVEVTASESFMVE